jgi:hypothetical protein
MKISQIYYVSQMSTQQPSRTVPVVVRPRNTGKKPTPQSPGLIGSNTSTIYRQSVSTPLIPKSNINSGNTPQNTGNNNSKNKERKGPVFIVRPVIKNNNSSYTQGPPPVGNFGMRQTIASIPTLPNKNQFISSPIPIVTNMTKNMGSLNPYQQNTIPIRPQSPSSGRRSPPRVVRPQSPSSGRRSPPRVVRPQSPSNGQRGPIPIRPQSPSNGQRGPIPIRPQSPSNGQRGPIPIRPQSPSNGRRSPPRVGVRPQSPSQERQSQGRQSPPRVIRPQSPSQLGVRPQSPSQLGVRPQSPSQLGVRPQSPSQLGVRPQSPSQGRQSQERRSPMAMNPVSRIVNINRPQSPSRTGNIVPVPLRVRDEMLSQTSQQNTGIPFSQSSRQATSPRGMTVPLPIGSSRPSSPLRVGPTPIRNW